ncbi:MAG: hypothetical protein K6F50_02005 [Kiritimatiellae bacterium]|nr:hypothetical protein [Kiritimatiellia bacterium]
MKKPIMLGGLAAVALAVTGCKTTLDDRWTSNLSTTLAPACFKPKYEVMKDRGIVKGTATESWWFWFISKEAPDTFTHERNGFASIVPTVADAALNNACASVGAQILLAPRYTVTKEKGILGFDGRTTVTVEGIPARLVGAEEVECKPACDCAK